MKKPGILLSVLALLTASANAQQQSKPPQQPMQDKLEATFRDPKAAERAAQADVLLVHQRRWVKGGTAIPAQSSIVPKNKKTGQEP